MNESVKHYTDADRRLAAVDRLLETWIQRYKGQSDDTGETYRYRLRAVLPEIMERGRRSKRLTTADAVELFESWQRRGWSEATLNTTLSAIRSFWHDMARDGYLPAECPFDAIRFRKADLSKRLDRVLTEAEAHAVIRACDVGRDRIFALFLLATGCRITEAVSATWSRFRRDGKGEIYWTFMGKGRKTRTVWIQPDLWIQLQALPGSHRPEDRLFPFTRFQGYHIIRRAANRAGLRSRIVSPHVLRHTHATLAVEAGVPIEEVAEQLGHASLQTTMIYVNLQPGPRSGRAIRIPDLEE